MTLQVVALTGISGVGKSTLIETLAASISFTHLQASTLIKEGRAVSGDVAMPHDHLRLSDINENQLLLIRGFRFTTEAITGLVVLDGHTVIEQDGGLARIDARIFGAVGIDCMIFLADDPETICRRRRNDTTRKRPVLSVDDLRFLQEETEDHAAAICERLGIPLYKFRPSQQTLVGETLRQRFGLE